MEHGEAADEPRGDEGVDDEHEGQRLAGHGPEQRPAVAPPLRGDVQPGQREDVEAQERGRRDEEEEEPVVALPRMNRGARSASDHHLISGS